MYREVNNRRTNAKTMYIYVNSKCKMYLHTTVEKSVPIMRYRRNERKGEKKNKEK